jgi:hypothetical protein
MPKRYIIQLRTDPAFDVIDTNTGLVVSVWNTEQAAAIDAATRLVIDLREARRAAREQRKGRANDDKTTTPLPSDRLMNRARNGIWGR